MSDLSLAQTLWGDPEVTALIGGPFTSQQVEERLAREVAGMRDYGVQYWPIFLLENDQFAGCAGLRPYKIEERVYDWEFICGASFGAAASPRRLAGRLLQSRVKRLGAKALFAGHHPANAASRRVLAKLGFQFTREELYPATGLRHPSYWLRL